MVTAGCSPPPTEFTAVSASALLLAAWSSTAATPRQRAGLDAVLRELLADTLSNASDEVASVGAALIKRTAIVHRTRTASTLLFQLTDIRLAICCTTGLRFRVSWSSPTQSIRPTAEAWPDRSSPSHSSARSPLNDDTDSSDQIGDQHPNNSDEPHCERVVVDNSRASADSRHSFAQRNHSNGNTSSSRRRMRDARDNTNTLQVCHPFLVAQLLP